ncbi:MAG: ABC transporter permease [Candidatus Acetothermia bacterium]
MIDKVIEKFSAHRELGPLLLLIILGVLFYAMNPAFLSVLNLSNMLAFIPEIGIIALGMTLLLTGGEFDLSVGALFGFTPVLMFILRNEGIMSIELAFFVVMAIAALIGFTNGILVTKVGISSFLVTIGMQLVVRGSGLYISNGFPQSSWQTQSPIKTALAYKIGFPDSFFQIVVSLFWFLALVAVGYYVLNHTRFGNWIMATGGNEDAARARGIKTDRVKIILFVITAVLAGLAGVIDAFRIRSAYPVSGTGYELEVIAMTVIGGTSLFGGRGTILGTVLGVLLLRTIRNGIVVVGVPGLAYNIFVGLTILAMMGIHAYLEKQSGGVS